MVVYLLIKRLIAHTILGHEHRKDVPGSGRRGGSVDEMIQDPCCKVYVPKSRSVKASSGGETHYFCSEDCARKYRSGRGCKG